MSAHDGHCPCAFSREKVGTTSAWEETRRINKGLMAITKLEIVLKWSKLRKLGYVAVQLPSPATVGELFPLPQLCGEVVPPSFPHPSRVVRLASVWTGVQGGA